MRYSTLIGSVILSSFLGCGLLSAQRGGGHSGGHASGGVSGHSSFAHSAGAGSVISGARAPIQPANIGLQPVYSGYTGINPGALRTSRFGQPFLSGRRGYFPGFVGYPYYLSTFDDYSEPFYYNEQAQDPYSQNAQVTANLLGEQIGRLSAEVDQLRAQGAGSAPYPQYYAPPADPPQSDDPPITLVMNDGNKMVLSSYAVMGQTFWDFSKQPARKIAMSNVNLAASEKATEAAGGEFPAIR